MDGNVTLGRRMQCEDGLRLRLRLVKLRWMGLDREADRLATQISELDCELPHPLPPPVFPTD